MKEIIQKCCGIDVHQKSLTACIIVPKGSVSTKQIRKFGTTSAEIHHLIDWLRGFGVTHVAIESTGVYWIPIYNLLEGQFDITLANARNVKNVPGRKTDCKDCEWLCNLLKNGLVEKSFIPPEIIRDLRLLTRHRDSLIKDRTRVKNRILKTLECGNIKLSSVLTDCFGKTGLKIINSLAGDNLNIQNILESLPKNIKVKKEYFVQALEGKLTEYQKIILKTLIRQMNFISDEISNIESEILEVGKEFEGQIKNLTTVPGIDTIGALGAIAEIGVDMNQFHSVHHLTSWACICPGNHESAGKKYSTHIRKGCNYLKSLLIQIAWAAAKSRTYLGEKYRRLCRKKGKKKALVAVGRKILTIIYFILNRGSDYYELGVDFFDKINVESKVRYHFNQLKKLGVDLGAV